MALVLENNTYNQRVNTLQILTEMFTDVFLRDLELPAMPSQFIAQYLSRATHSKKVEILNIAKKQLESWGIRNLWNSILKEQRSNYIAQWCRPYVYGTVLDLLCGDGSVGINLSNMGFNVAFTERVDNYPEDMKCDSAFFFPFDKLTTEEIIPKYDTVLLCTVLHHELDPRSLLALSVKLARKRIVIIENCIELIASADIQSTIDLFFNKCLNEISIECPSNHMSICEWGRIASQYGYFQWIDRKDNIPGVPLPHDLFIIAL